MAGVVAGAVALGVGVGFFLNRSGGVSAATYIAQADAVCQPANASLSVTRPADYAGLATAAGALATATEGQVTRLRTLPVPGGDAGAEARLVVTDLDLVLQASRGLQDAAARSDDAATVAAVKRLTSTSADATGAAGAFGMTACGTGLRESVQSLTLGSQSLVKTAFVAKADALCRAAAVEYADLGTPVFETRDDLLEYLEVAIAMGDRLSTGFEALPIPPGDEATVAELWAAADAIQAKNRAAQAAALNGNPAGFAAAGEEVPEMAAAFDAKLDAYGLVTCGSGFEDL